MPWLLLDVAWLVLFAALGRQSHGEGQSLAGVAGVAWPFLAGYAVGAVAVRLDRAPRSLARLLPVWGLTVAIAMAIRTIQLGRALGARVAVTAGTAAKLERCEALGAEGRRGGILP